jgi:hypothetical protein
MGQLGSSWCGVVSNLKMIFVPGQTVLQRSSIGTQVKVTYGVNWSLVINQQVV